MLLPLLYLLICFNLIRLLMDKTNTFYKDVRFWIILLSLFTLAWMVVRSYPAE